MGLKREWISGSSGSLKIILSGILWGAAVLLVGGLIVALLINSRTIEVESAAYGIVLTLLAASFVSAFVSTGVGNGVWLAALANAVGMVLLLLLGNTVLGIGRVEGALQSSLVIICGGLCAVLLRLKPKKGRTHRRKKY